MRRIVYAASFVDQADDIAAYLQSHFGPSRATAFIEDLDRFCGLLAENPGFGRLNHGYGTALRGVVHGMNWIFFESDHAEIRFVHIVDGRRDRATLRFRGDR